MLWELWQKYLFGIEGGFGVDATTLIAVQGRMQAVGVCVPEFACVVWFVYY